MVQGVASGSAIGSSPLATVEPVLRGPKAVKFAFLDDYRGIFSKARACRVMGVTDRGLRAWKHRPVSHRQRRDMSRAGTPLVRVSARGLAHIRDQHRSSLGSYGRPRMTEELNELGVRVGHPLPGNGLPANRERGRVGRLMRQNAISVVSTGKFKVEEGQKMIRGIIFPTTHRQRSQVQHIAESPATRLRCEPAQPEVPYHGLHANHCRVTGR